MRRIILRFNGGYWDGRKLCSDASDQEESLFATACYEMTHHGSIGEQCPGLSDDAVTFARIHGWQGPQDATMYGDHSYMVTERHETKDEIIITLTRKVDDTVTHA